jgi:hypothetical protein
VVLPIVPVVTTRKRMDVALIGVVLLAAGIALLSAGRLLFAGGLWTAALAAFAVARQR